MCQKEMFEATVQADAMQELKDLTRPLFQKLVRCLRSRPVTTAAEADVALRPVANAHPGRMQARES